MVEPRPSLGTPEQALPPPSAPFEREEVREFEPPAALVTHAPPQGPGVAVAAPVKIEWPSDLVQVESDPGKIGIAQHAQQDDEREQSAPRPKRVRQATQPLSEEPLVQIETSDADRGATGGAEGKTPAVPG